MCPCQPLQSLPSHHKAHTHLFWARCYSQPWRHGHEQKDGAPILAGTACHCRSSESSTLSQASDLPHMMLFCPESWPDRDTISLTHLVPTWEFTSTLWPLFITSNMTEQWGWASLRMFRQAFSKMSRGFFLNTTHVILGCIWHVIWAFGALRNC